jgi:hypothetical protein
MEKGIYLRLRKNFYTMHKIILSLAFCSSLFFTSQAQTVATTSTLNAVTVYSSGAELSHTASTRIPSGNSEVVI